MSAPAFNYEDFDEILYLGNGSFGTVSLYNEKTTKRLVAIKSMKKDHFRNPYGQQMLRRELEFHYHLKHEHIVGLYGFFYDAFMVHIVLEACCPKNLARILEIKKELTVPRASYIADCIGSALQFCHERLLIHRDVKPANILFWEGWKPKLADFGLCVQNSDGRRHTYCGTIDYAAPELADPTEKRGHDYKVDVWSLGVVFYEMLEGRHPFKEMSNARKKETVRTGILHGAVKGPLLAVNDRKRIELSAFRADQNFQKQVKMFHRRRLDSVKQGCNR
uniref:Aurora kinase n=1 Tax=Panagrellus redivivus TaxID=6233 RepID=A0A7E4VR24_PANRE